MLVIICCKLEVGSLVVFLVNIELIDGRKVNVGDVGVVLDLIAKSEQNSLDRFDYLVLINNIEIYAFKDEIQVYV